MQRALTRRAVLGGLLSSAVGLEATAAGLTASVRPVLRPEDLARLGAPEAEALIRGARLSGDVCFAVCDAGTGAVLEAGRGDWGLPPASVAKAITALYALEALGAEHRFATRVLATGQIVGGVVQGDLILQGGGDPTLDTDGLALLAERLKAVGISGVTGAFIVDDSLFPETYSIDAGQPDQVGYSPAVSGIALNFNRVHFEWRRANKGYAVTMQARTERYRPDVVMAKMQIAERQAPVYEFAATPAADEWSVARGALGKGGARWLPVRKPALYAGDVFRTLARGQGIALKPAQVRALEGAEAVPLAQVQSAPLDEILQGMLRFSTNLTAEMVGQAATRARVGSVPTLKSSALEMSRWAEAHLGAANTQMVDHSGLGDASRMTANGMAQALVAAYKANLLRPILKPFAMRDGNGRPQKDHPVQVAAKTGTLNFVSGLAGYMKTAAGRDLTFAIFAADTKSRAGIPRAQRENPPGARAWNRRARALQRDLIERWDRVYRA